MNFRSLFSEPISTLNNNNNNNNDNDIVIENVNTATAEPVEEEKVVEKKKVNRFAVKILCPRGYGNVDYRNRHNFNECLINYYNLMEINEYSIHQYIESWKDAELNQCLITFNGSIFTASEMLMKFLNPPQPKEKVEKTEKNKVKLAKELNKPKSNDNTLIKVQIYVASGETINSEDKNNVIEKKHMQLNKTPVVLGKAYAKYCIKIIAMPVIVNKKLDFDYFITYSPFSYQRFDTELLSKQRKIVAGKFSD